MSSGGYTGEHGASRARLAGRLRAGGWAGAAVSEAFATVPRHVFVPREPAGLAYQDQAITIKSGPGGLAVSASTQPALMALMLGELELAAGQRVLEIGTGSGYNAALIAHLVGERGSVVTIELDPGLAGQARTRLAAAGCAGVTVVCGDGAAGAPDWAPYDRVIVTAGVWDLAPQWLAQLRPGGRIVAPVSVRGIQLAAAFRDAGTHWVSRRACRCQFIRMTGPSAGPEAIVPPGLQPGPPVLAADGPAPAAGPLYQALSGRPAAVRPELELRVSGLGELADLDLWLALDQPGLSRLAMAGGEDTRARPGRRRAGRPMPLGGFARQDSAGQLGVAALAVPPGTASGGRPFPVTVNGHGPGGAALAGHLARRAAAWDALGRPGAGTLELAAYPAGTRPEAAAGSVIIRRPGAVLVARWPPAAV